jgi:hypothetical protein
MYRLLRPGGRIVVQVPYLRGVSGWLQRLASQEIMALHNPLDPGEIASHLSAAGFERVEAHYVGREPIGVVNWPARNAFPRPLWFVSMGVQKVIDRAIGVVAGALSIPPQVISSSVLGLGTRPMEESQR